MRTALALVAVIGLMGAGVALSSPPKAKNKLQPVAKLNDGPVAPAISGAPAGPPISPPGWIINGPSGGAFVPRIVHPSAAGWQDTLPGGMLGSTAVDTIFSSPTMNRSTTILKVRVNGFSEVHGPGYAAFGVGPSAPGGNFTLTNTEGTYSVTAVP